MNLSTISKKASLGLTTLVVALLMSGATVSAITYIGADTSASPVPAFNVYTGNIPAPAPADGEQYFFRGRVPANGNLSDPSTPYADPVSTTCTNGQLIQLHVYVHNAASTDLNTNGSGPSVAHGTTVKVALPDNQAASFYSTATISATNAATVSDGLTINCNGQSVTLQYVAGSASQYSIASGVVALSDSIVSTGAAIQSEKVPGDVWGCWNERVYVVLTVKIVVSPTPPPVVPPTPPVVSPTPPPVVPPTPPVVPPKVVPPTTLVNTGPGDVASLFVAATAIGTIGHYIVVTRRLSRD